MIGIDEVGRGCLAGPLVVVGVYWPTPDPPDRPPACDSKQLKTPAIRASAAAALLRWLPPEHIRVWVATPRAIDRTHNILTSTMEGMNAVAADFPDTNASIWVDGNRFQRLDPRLADRTVHTVVKGDATLPIISMASMLAKHLRDRCMEGLCTTYPTLLAPYGNPLQHQGYLTKRHLAGIRHTNCFLPGYHRCHYRLKEGAFGVSDTHCLPWGDHATLIDITFWNNHECPFLSTKNISCSGKIRTSTSCEESDIGPTEVLTSPSTLDTKSSMSPSEDTIA